MTVQVIDVVLVQFAQFHADTGNLLIHLASEVSKRQIHIRPQAVNSLIHLTNLFIKPIF